MPNRILKESICSSPDIDQLTPEEEIFFYRLMVNCDDYGLCDARPEFLISKCFPMRIYRVKPTKVKQYLKKLVSVGLIILYQVDQRPYLKLAKWENHQQVRAKKAKYPLPSDDNICNQMISDDNNCPRNPIQSESNPNPIQSEEIIFNAWKLIRKHPRAVLDDKRKSKIEARIKEKRLFCDFISAIYGIGLSDYHMGKSENNTTVYDDIELICRDAQHLERFRNLWLKKREAELTRYFTETVIQQPAEKPGVSQQAKNQARDYLRSLGIMVGDPGG
jgi:hypothetical protein